MQKSNSYNCVYYWNGGTEMGRWQRADFGTIDDIKKAGFVAYNGHTSIGPPDEAPSKADIDKALGR